MFKGEESQAGFPYSSFFREEWISVRKEDLPLLTTIKTGRLVQ